MPDVPLFYFIEYWCSLYTIFCPCCNVWWYIIHCTIHTLILIALETATRMSICVCLSVTASPPPLFSFCLLCPRLKQINIGRQNIVAGSCEYVMNLRVPQNAGSFLTCWESDSFSGRTLLRGINQTITGPSEIDTKIVLTFCDYCNLFIFQQLFSAQIVGL